MIGIVKKGCKGERQCRAVQGGPCWKLAAPACGGGAAKRLRDNEVGCKEELKRAEDDAIMVAIKTQENVGLLCVTDGECRRSFWHYDFLGMNDGLDLVEEDEGIRFAGVNLRPIFPVISGKLGSPGDHPMLEHFQIRCRQHGSAAEDFRSRTQLMLFPSGAGKSYPQEYEDLNILFADIAATYRDAMNAFYEVGCRYLQMDDIFFAYLCDPVHRNAKRSLGQDPDWLIDRYAWMMNEAKRVGRTTK